MDYIHLNTFLFYLIAAITGLCAIAVVVTQNIVRAATWLLFALAGTSGIFFLIGFDFVGATQLLVYVGGTLVLVVFGVMLTAQGPFINIKVGAAEWVIAALVGILLFSVLTISSLATNLDYRKSTVESDPASSNNSMVIGQGFLGVGVGPQHEEGQKESQGGTENRATQKIGTSYLLPFEIVSVHLLVVLVGAAYLARAKRRRGAES